MLDNWGVLKCFRKLENNRINEVEVIRKGFLKKMRLELYYERWVRFGLVKRGNDGIFRWMI